jgi:hypothetical protein
MSTALRHSIRYAYAWVDQNPDQFVNVVLISEMEIGFDCVFTSLADFELATADVRVPLSPVKLSVISLSGDTYAAETIASMHFGNAVSALDDASDLTPQVEQALLDRSQMYFSR